MSFVQLVKRMMPSGKYFRQERAMAFLCAARGFLTRTLAVVLLSCLASGISQAGLWCRGDLHSHSSLSDGDSPVADVVAEAERQGFDFLALTDHDTSMSGVPKHWSDPAYESEKMALFYGVEWTTGQGHANVWAAAPFDYGPLWEANQNSDPEAAVRAIHAQGGLFSLNHPAEIVGHPWNFPLPEGTDCIEVWNSMFMLPSTSFAAVKWWDRLLRQGRRITAVGGSDKHDYYGWRAPFFTLGMPLTWVWAQERTAEAILAGIQKGHVTISYSVDSPRLELAADTDDDGEFETMMGDAGSAPPGAVLALQLTITASNPQAMSRGCSQEVLLDSLLASAGGGIIAAAAVQQTGCATMKNPPVYLALVYKNGNLSRAWLVGGEASIPFRALAGPGDYFRAELKGMVRTPVPLRLLYGYTIAITNPVYMEADAGQ